MSTLETIQVPAQITEKWQEIIDLLAEVLRVPSALIMKVEPPNIRVFVRSELREIHTRGMNALPSTQDCIARR